MSDEEEDRQLIARSDREGGLLQGSNLLERALPIVLDSNSVAGFCRKVMVGTPAVERLPDFTP